jgi:hypothetical protein
VSVQNNRDSSTRVWVETCWSGIRVHNFRWTCHCRDPTEPIVDSEEEEEEDSKPAAVQRPAELFMVADISSHGIDIEVDDPSDDSEIDEDEISTEDDGEIKS